MRDEPAGWYRDDERPTRHRYWTGERWRSEQEDAAAEACAAEREGMARHTSRGCQCR